MLDELAETTAPSMSQAVSDTTYRLFLNIYDGNMKWKRTNTKGPYAGEVEDQ